MTDPDQRPVRALVIHPNDTYEVRERFEPELAALNQVVGGYIEGVQFSGWHMYVNEEGKLHGLPRNEAATMLAHHYGLSRSDMIVGSVIVFGNHRDLEGDAPGPVIDLTANWATRVTAP